MWNEDEEIERYSESLRNRESRDLATELGQAYSRLKLLGEEERVNPEGSEDRERVLEEQVLLRRKIGALEEEIGRRKKNEAWPW
ncbi:MAG TPA: hypothetical protein VED17_01145 [Nitrososphaerales archaeon]|nr:hypothetical protein [Nitrososphaerales archaeon]